jgi:Glycosyl transferase family 2
MLDHITPVILTYNEEPNIRRTLSALDWAQRIIAVDSGSTDSTLSILAADSRVTVFSRAFDTHAAQWDFAVNRTDVHTNWVLRLDADYCITQDLRAELAKLDPNAPVSAYRIAFDYMVYGRCLRGTLYPPNTVLFRKGRATPFDRGHTEAWAIDGRVVKLKGRILHDDRKPMADWLSAQGRYIARELPHLKTSTPSLARALRLKPPLMPVLSFIYCLFFKGLILDGRAGLFYSLQRLLFESGLGLAVLEDRLRAQSEPSHVL